MLWNRGILLVVVLGVCGGLLWTNVASSDSTPVTIGKPDDAVVAITAAVERPATLPPVSSSNTGDDALADTRVVRLHHDDGRLRCGKNSNVSTRCLHWFERSWFSDSRDPTDNAPFVPTLIRSAESRALDPKANVTNNEVEIAMHHAAHWRSHWSVRYPSIQWNANRSTTQRERAVLPADVLESRAQLQLRDIEASQRPRTIEDVEFLQNVPPIYLFRREAPERRWEALDAKAGSRTTRTACLFAGFPRNIEKMFASCRDFKSERSCRNVYTNKLFGNMRDNIVASTQCDAFVTTWEIRGAGRYSTTTYDMSDAFPPTMLHTVFGDQLAVAHVQNFTQYQQLWTYMHKYSRVFPQARPTQLHVDQLTKASSFDSVPELNHFIRINDYSQSYKHWVVVHLALLSNVAYDLFFRLRLDLRVQSRLDTLQPVMLKDLKSHGTRAVAFRLESSPYGGKRPAAVSVLTPPMHHVSATRVHVGNFDIADFGFMGPPFMIEELSRLWYYCLTTPASPLAPYDFARAVTPEEMYSEYNLMLWRIIFENKWSVDSGGRYLWVSRYGKKRRTK